MLQPGSEFCPECGAPVSKAPAAEGSDSVIYPELARANLLRMRAEYKQAEDQCLTILKRYPNNVSAHVLLGDICAEINDLDQAMQWYELALELAPDSGPTVKKLHAVRDRMKKIETAATAEQIGLPPAQSHHERLIVGLVAAIVAVGAIAYIVGANMQHRSDTAAGVQKTTTNAPPQNGGIDAKSGVVDAKTGQQSSDNTGAASPSTQLSPEDQALALQINQKSPDGGRVISISKDPRSSQIALAYVVGAAEDPRARGAQLAKVAFGESPTTRLITLRALRGGALAFVADCRKEALDETETQEWKAQNDKDPTAWIAHILTDEWTPPVSAAKPATDATTTGSANP